MRHAALLLALLLPACASGSGPGTASDRCARQADDNPAYKADLAKAAGSLEYQWQYGAKMEAERQAAIGRCLGGLNGHRGGVERAQ